MADSPDKKHPEYIAKENQWEKCRAAVAGQEAVKAAGKAYLPILKGQDIDDYLSYVARASYFNATGRTVDTMLGMVFRKPMTVELPNQISDWVDDITLSDETLEDFAQSLLSEVTIVGRVGILVDSPAAPDRAISKAEAEKLKARPYLTQYAAENILNWNSKRVNGVYQLFNVWLLEDSEEEGVEMVRQLTIESGSYIQVIYKKISGKDWYVDRTIIPTKAGKTFTSIPFYFLSCKDIKSGVENSPINSLADVNISHYQNSADLENGAHIAGQPMLVVTGMDQPTSEDGSTPDPIYIGSSTALVISNDKAKAAFISCGSEGFASLEKLMDRKEDQMAKMGAQLLAQDKRGVEAAETANIKRSGEAGVLATMASVVARQLTKAITFAAEWVSVTGKVMVELNKDYYPVTFTAADLTAWVKARQSGEVSEETFFDVLKASEWLPDQLDFEGEKERKAESSDPLGGVDDPDPDEVQITE